MGRKLKWHSSNTGKEFEDKICNELDMLGKQYVREKVAHSKSGARTQRGKFDLRIIEPHVVIELKSKGVNSISYSLYAEDKGNPNIKGHQLTALYKEYFTNGLKAGLLLEYRPNKPVFILIQDFYAWACQSTRKSITHEIALNIGLEIEHIKELLE